MTFGCFNNLAKINDAVVAVRTRVFDAVPESRLVLKRARFAARGIAEERVLLEPASSRADYLRAHDRIDMALDPFPFPGGATSCEALRMGVPLLTRMGDRFLSRVGETVIRSACLSDWLADDDDDYVMKAVRFGSDLDRLEQLLASPLFDARHFARHFEAALWSIWTVGWIDSRRDAFELLVASVASTSGWSRRAIAAGYQMVSVAKIIGILWFNPLSDGILEGGKKLDVIGLVPLDVKVMGPGSPLRRGQSAV